jgi:hypothetical protein
MASVLEPVGDQFLQAMADTLTDDMRRYLKAPLMLLAEEYIDNAVKVAVDEMRPRIEAHLRQYDMTAIINVIQAPSVNTGAKRKAA